MKYYILHEASYFGMGSDVDEFLISEDEIHERWTDDEIHIMLTECHNYSGFNELVPLPENAEVIEDHVHMDKVVFHIKNQWGFDRDIVVGEADFYKRIVDLTNSANICRFEGGGYIEFTAFSFKNVLEQHYFMDSVEYIMRVSADRKKRSEDALKGIRKKQGFVDEYIAIDDNVYKAWIREDEAIHDKFAKPIDVPDDYLSHIYKGRSACWYERLYGDWEQEMEKLTEIDYREQVFKYPIGPRSMGGEYSEHRDIRACYGLDEIFTHGADVKSRFYAYTGDAKEIKDLDGINVLLTICDTFGYD